MKNNLAGLLMTILRNQKFLPPWNTSGNFTLFQHAKFLAEMTLVSYQFNLEYSRRQNKLRI